MSPPEDLKDILEKLARLASQKHEPDAKDDQEEAAVREAAARAQAAEEAVAGARSRREMREDYAKKIFYYLIGYSIGAFTLLMLNGFQVRGFHISDVPLTAIVGSTAVSAIGLVGFVVNGLFGGAKKRQESKKSEP